ncbi:MAG: hypothetical protein MK086_08270 [Flavobacteriales bacterium]|nr:hypothetical protein [Flavobacteriales bacterium]
MALFEEENNYFTVVDVNGRMTKEVPKFKIYKIKKGYTNEYCGFTVGDSVKFTMKSGVVALGEVLGIAGQDRVAIRWNGKIYLVAASDVSEVVKE